MKFFIIKIAMLLSLISLYADECPDQYSPALFSDTSEYFNELMQKSFTNLKLFDYHKSYKKLNFLKAKDGFWYKKNSFVVKGDYKYPIVDGIWAYHVNEKTKKIDEIKIAMTYIYKMDMRDLTEEISVDYGAYWSDWEGDASESILTPDNAKIKYQDNYMTLRVQLYGTNNDSTNLKFSVANFWIYDYSKEVESFNRCKKLLH